MTLAEYLKANDIKPSVFAAEIGVAPSTITRLIAGERSPRLPLIALIRDKTDGAVGLDDFMSAPERAA